MADGVLKCAENGKRGETYILSGEYVTIERLFEILSVILGRRPLKVTVPLNIVRLLAPLIERIERIAHLPLLVTPYSIYMLGSNGSFSCEKAARELGYSSRPIEETLRDAVIYLNKFYST